MQKSIKNPSKSTKNRLSDPPGALQRALGRSRRHFFTFLSILVDFRGVWGYRFSLKFRPGAQKVASKNQAFFSTLKKHTFSRSGVDFCRFLVNSGRADPSSRLRRRVRNTHSVKIDFFTPGGIFGALFIDF